MNIKEVEFNDNFKEFCEALNRNGAFLLVDSKEGKRNIMTIGWASIGVIWSEPVMCVLVRPSRYTHEFMEKAKHFSVNVPVKKLKKELGYCGSHSGRDSDKEAECKFQIEKGQIKGVSVIEQCDLFYECEIIHKNEVQKDHLDPLLNEKFYLRDDYHTIYFGKILKAYRKS